jgi:23S rRNA (cytidine1920-2'-O)/16S rRNA (cytidine1409-2'-O)-methyltransferase
MATKKPGTARSPLRSKKERIDVLLVERGLVESRTRAAARILAGDVLVDDHRIDKPGDLVAKDAAVRLRGEGLAWVSRGGTKLEGALAQWAVAVDGVVCVDVGASTGGFTDVLLSRGAARVYAVDVGYGQLAHKLRVDPRVVVMERTHINKLDPGAFDPAPAVAVIDVSFISLTKVLPGLALHLAPACTVVALIKPQFEVGRDHVGKGGIVRDDEERLRSVERVLACARDLGFTVEGTIDSPIKGADGNVEHLTCLRRAASS